MSVASNKPAMRYLITLKDAVVIWKGLMVDNGRYATDQ